MDKKIRETLEKQLQLLSERSENAVDGLELTEITEAMIRLAEALRFSPQDRLETTEAMLDGHGLNELLMRTSNFHQGNHA